jgi:hypothetical protein
MDEARMTELARAALKESGRNDCELIGVKAGGGGAWSVELLDVMQTREAFTVRVSVLPEATEAEVREAIRRGVAEHFSIESY